MSQQIDYSVPGDPFVAPANLNRRFVAGVVDATVMALLCLGLFLRFGPEPFGEARGWVWKPCAILLAMFFLLEILSGLTAGKVSMGFGLRDVAGQRAAIWRLTLRAIFREAPVGIFVMSLLTDGELAKMIWLFCAVTLAICYIPMCYISIFRTGRTTFDLAAGTVAIRRVRATPISKS